MATNKEIIQFTAKGLKGVQRDVKKLEKQMRQLDRAYRQSAKSSKGVTSSMGAMIAKLGLGYLAFRALTGAVTSSIRVAKDFEKEMSNVAAISGATGDQLKALEANAKELGRTTIFTASNVAELSTSFAKLGFSADEIIKVTKGTLDLAAVTRVDLAEAAAVAGTTLRAFGLSAGETGRVTDVMALSFSRSALDMRKFTDSMKFVAPVAKKVGFTIEGTTAIMGALANAGIDGSLAGTALRTIFLKLADTNSSLSKKLGGSVKSATDLVPALKKLKDSGIDLTEMLGLVDKRAVTAFSILVDGSEDVDKLKLALDGAAGSAKKMADIQLDNLAGSMTRLKSATEGLQIAWVDTFGETLRRSTDSLTTIVTRITSMVEVINKVKGFAVTAGKGIRDYAEDYFGLKKAVKEATEEITKQQRVLAFGKQMQEIQAAMALVDAGQEAFKKGIIEEQNLFALLFGEISGSNQAMRNFADLQGVVKKAGLQIALDALIKKANEAGISFKAMNKALDPKDGAGDPDKPTEDPAVEKTKERFSMEAALYEQFLDERTSMEDFGFEIQQQAAAEQYVNLLAMSQQYGIDEEELVKFTTQKMIRIEAAAVAARLSIHSGLASGLASVAGQFKGGLVASARLQQIAAVIDAYAAMNKAMGAYPPPYNFIAAASVGATAFANVMSISQSIGEFKSAATGADEVVTRPTMFLTGEAGAEHVQVTPLGGAGSAKGSGAGAGSIVINISAPLVDETVIDSIIPAIAKAQRLGLA